MQPAPKFASATRVVLDAPARWAFSHLALLAAAAAAVGALGMSSAALALHAHPSHEQKLEWAHKTASLNQTFSVVSEGYKSTTTEDTSFIQPFSELTVSADRDEHWANIRLAHSSGNATTELKCVLGRIVHSDRLSVECYNMAAYSGADVFHTMDMTGQWKVAPHDRQELALRLFGFRILDEEQIRLIYRLDATLH